MKRMLINATQPEELRVAIAKGQHLLDLDIEVPSADQKKGNIYKAVITRVEASLEACFVDFGSERHGFLPMKEINPSCYHESAPRKDGKPSIREVVREGQELIIQVTKEERGNKGAALTTNISLAGRYMVLMPTNGRAGGVSRRIEGEERQTIKEQLKQLDLPKGMGLIVRTACVGRDQEELQWDLDYLLHLWSAIEKASESRKAPFLIYQESNLIIRALRDYLRQDIGEILIDDEKTYNDAREFMQSVMPHNLRKLKLYQDRAPLFNRYQIESQIESAFARQVHLPSGGSIVIDNTEALVAIDINSARSTKGGGIEETAYHTNLEAADEIARQFRLRDMGGLVVIDFIDMSKPRHQKDVEDRLRQAVKMDKARIQIGKISRFGLLEMSRQRLRPSLGESSKETCPRCDGQGRIRSIESLSLSILRLMEEESMKDYSGQIIAEVPASVANFLLNEKRDAVTKLEQRSGISILILANNHMEHPKFEIRRIRKSEVSDEPSFEQTTEKKADVIANQLTQATVSLDQPAVSGISPPQPVPERKTVEPPKTPGLLARVFSFLGGGSEEEKTRPQRTHKKASKKRAKKVARKTGQQQVGRGQQHRSQQQTGQPGGRKKTTKKKTGKKKTSRRRGNVSQKTATGTQPANQSAKNPEKGSDRNNAAANARAESPQARGGSHKPESADSPDSSRRQPRRRRSPYKTASKSNRSQENRPRQTNMPAENSKAVTGTVAVTRLAEPKAASNPPEPVTSGTQTQTATRQSPPEQQSASPKTAKPKGATATGKKAPADPEKPSTRAAKHPSGNKLAAARTSPETKPAGESNNRNKGTPPDNATRSKPQAEKPQTKKTGSGLENAPPAASEPKPARGSNNRNTDTFTDNASRSKPQAEKPQTKKTGSGLENAPPAASEPPPGLYKLKQTNGKLEVEPLKKNPLQASIDATREKPDRDRST